jgi:hypothetical protein
MLLNSAAMKLSDLGYIKPKSSELIRAQITISTI